MPTSAPRSGKAWYILHYTDHSNDTAHDILYLNNPIEPLSTACTTLELTLLSCFDRYCNRDTDDAFRIARLALLRPECTDLQITLLQLVAFLREMPPAPPGVMIPDLWGFGGNSLEVTLKYV